ncbi:MAG TPA: alpha-L-arabinofuranosidase C-terminal domain-containing protein, partial [Pyrinomonadaceae bacterium]|nr:alpha-L-arabinofuranosidase C-terminal domain-containing protein [Pyrinomonadaceae bacterium]
HLGGVIYDGVWVGEKSKIPNTGGVRSALVEAMRKIKPGVIRWPGGCFADSYDWRDGIGPRGARPRRTDFWINDKTMGSDSPQVYEPNHFGTNEFLRFSKSIGAQPYLAANVRSLPAKDFYEWVEYCNAPANMTTLSKMRAESGDREPFNVRYWGVGNESWGCGGQMTPEEYADQFRRYIAWVPRYGVKLAFIGSGPNSGDWKWTRGFFSRLAEKGEGSFNSLYGWALHYYCGSTGKKVSTEYTVDEWYELIGKADRMESLITGHWAIMGEIDVRRRTKLIVDEWGAWHDRAKDMPETYLWAYPGALRDALVSGLTLDTFNRHADKVAMANVAQLVNTIHSLFLAYEDKFTQTPNYHVFEMYAAHQGGQSVRTLFSAPNVTYNVGGKPATLWGLQGSASLNGKQLVLTVVNPHHEQARETEIAVRGATVRIGNVRTLSSTDIHAHNSFANPHALEPKDAELNAAGQTIVFQFPPASVTRLLLTLA